MWGRPFHLPTPRTSRFFHSFCGESMPFASCYAPQASPLDAFDSLPTLMQHHMRDLALLVRDELNLCIHHR